ncbi:MAG: hypothetical protein WCI56_07130 [Hyphomicrobiales bacterium]
MNSSLYTADRATHLKIVVVALIAATAIAAIGIAARGVNLGTDVMVAQRAPVVKAGAPVVWTAREINTIR